MSKPSMLDALLARRTALEAAYAALLRKGDLFGADDLVADLRFVTRQCDDALMGRC